MLIFDIFISVVLFTILFILCDFYYMFKYDDTMRTLLLKMILLMEERLKIIEEKEK